MASFYAGAIAEFNLANALKIFTQALPREAVSKENADMQCDSGLTQKLMKRQEKDQPSPECISYKPLTHCVLGVLEVSDDAEEK